MAEAFLSPDWYRVAGLRPRIRGHVDVHRQTFRGDVWFVVQEHHSGTYHRISPVANHIMALMDGRRTLHEIWEAACARFEDEPPTQGETIRLLSQLHASDLIASDLPPDLAELGARHARQARKKMMARFKNPMALKFPLLDPDRFLSATLPLVRWLFTPFGFVLWLALIVTGLTLLALNWSQLTEGFSDRVLAFENVLLLLFAYPLVKLLHELGHGYAAKSWGGAVHEVGVMFLVFIPVPYVDASSSAAFPGKWRRAVVGGAGIMVELALASLALIFWVTAEPGLLRAFAFNIMLIGGVSTLLFNGNPLLRFDGYFVFADLVEIPGLGQRANRYFWFLVKRAFGVTDARSPVTARGEARWLFGYAVAAFVYRMFISFAIALFVAGKFFFIGVALAIWALANTLLLPVFKGAKYLVTSKELRGNRARAYGVTGAVLAGLAALLFYVPVPYTTVSYGVVWLDGEDVIRTETSGFVQKVTFSDAQQVQVGDTIMVSEDPLIDARLALQRLRLEEAQLRLTSVALSDRVQAQVFRERAQLLEGRIADLERRKAGMVSRAVHAGTAILPYAENLDGRLIQQGEVLGYVLGDRGLRMRVAIPQDRAELVRTRTRAVEMRLMSDLSKPIFASIVGEVPQSQTTVPSMALSTQGGGDIVLNPAAPDRMTTLAPVFVFDIAPDEDMAVARVGERALVKFDHGTEPVGLRIWRGARQLFLRQFAI